MAASLLLALILAAVLLAAAVSFIGVFRRFRGAVHGFLAATPDIIVRAYTLTGIAVTVAGHPLTMDLLRPWFRRTARTPAVLADLLRSRVPPAAIPPLPLVRDGLLPILKRAGALPPPTGYIPANRILREPFDGEVVLAYVIEGWHQVTYVTEGMLAAWSLTRGALHSRALANLRAKTAHLLGEIGGPRRDYIALDGFEAARLLVADLLASPDVVDPVFAIPDEHALHLRPGRDASALEAEAARHLATAAHPLTARLYRWTPAGPVPKDDDRT